MIRFQNHPARIGQKEFCFQEGKAATDLHDLRFLLIWDDAQLVVFLKKELLNSKQLLLIPHYDVRIVIVPPIVPNTPCVLDFMVNGVGIGYCKDLAILGADEQPYSGALFRQNAVGRVHERLCQCI